MPLLSHALDALMLLVLPAFVAAMAVTAAVSWLGGAKQGPAAVVLGLVVGAGVGVWLNNTLPLVPGASTLNLLPWAAVAALVVGRLAHNADVHFSDGWLVRGGASLAIAYWIIPENTRNESVWITPAFAATVFALWELTDRLADLPGSFSVGVCLAASLLVAGAVLLFAGSARLMDANVILAFALVGVTLTAYWRTLPIGSAGPALAVALPGMLLIGQQTTPYEQFPEVAFAIPALAPLLLVVTIPLAQWPKWRLHLMRLALIAIPLIAALVMSVNDRTE